MLNITDAAYSRLHEMLEMQPAEIAARISRKGDRTRLRRGKQRPGDQVIEHEGRIVLLLGKAMARRLQGRILDVRQTKAGPKLGLRRDQGDPAAN